MDTPPEPINPTSAEVRHISSNDPRDELTRVVHAESLRRSQAFDTILFGEAAPNHLSPAITIDQRGEALDGALRQLDALLTQIENEHPDGAQAITVALIGLAGLLGAAIITGLLTFLGNRQSKPPVIILRSAELENYFGATSNEYTVPRLQQRFETNDSWQAIVQRLISELRMDVGLAWDKPDVRLEPNRDTMPVFPQRPRVVVWACPDPLGNDWLARWYRSQDAREP